MAGGEEYSDDRANGGDGQSDRVRANHPFAVQRDFAAANMPERPTQRDQKKCAEQNGCGGLVDASDGVHREAHDQRRNAND